MFRSKGDIDDTTMVKFEKKKGHEGQPGQQAHGGPHQVQPMQEDAPQHLPLHPMMHDYICGMANWAQATSAQLYVDNPYFGAELSLAAHQHRQRPLQSNAFERFGTEENMEHYFVDQRGRAQVREQRVRDNYVCGKTASEQRANDFYADIQGHSEDTEDEQ